MYLIIYQIYSCLKDIILDRSALEIFHPRHILDTDRLRTGFSVVHKDPDAYYEEESIVEASPVSTSQTPNEQDRYQRILNLYQTSSSKSSSRSIEDDFDDDDDDDDDEDDDDDDDDICGHSMQRPGEGAVYYSNVFSCCASLCTRRTLHFTRCTSHLTHHNSCVPSSRLFPPPNNSNAALKCGINLCRCT